MSEVFVLVHGAWHGAWCWAGVIGELERQGYRAYAVDLPGRPGNPVPHAQVNRHVWVDSVVQFIEQHDLRDVNLVGHSYGGLTITGVALKIPQLIKRCIYATALVPPDEGSLADEFPRLVTPEMAAAMQQVDGGVSSLMDAEYFRRAFIQDGSRDLQDFVFAALVPEAMQPMADAAPMKQFRALNIPTSYIACEDDLVLGDPAAWHPGFSGRLHRPTIKSLKCGHELMFTQPVATARALIELSVG